MKTIRLQILVSINAAECEKLFLFCLSGFCPVNKSVCCLRELDRESETKKELTLVVLARKDFAVEQNLKKQKLDRGVNSSLLNG